jgi:hypothetical protein
MTTLSAHDANEEYEKAQIRLFKRMYISIWFKKIHYALKHKTPKPFQSL